MPPDSSPEKEEIPIRVQRMNEVRYAINKLVTEQEVKLETESTGLRVSLRDGLNIYFHAGSEEISTVQELDILSTDTVFRLSFEPHSFDDESLGIVTRSIYRIGKRGIDVARKPRNLEAADTHSDKPAGYMEVLHLSRALGHIFTKKKDETEKANPDE